MRHAKLSLLILLLAGCAPSMSRANLWSPRQMPRVGAYPVRVAAEPRPRCAFDELARVSVSLPNTAGSMDAVVESIRARTREIGGDAVVGLASEDQLPAVSVKQDASAEVGQTRVVSGTIIKFRTPACSE